MSLEPAITKAWEALSKVNLETDASVRFLADEFSVVLKERTVLKLPHKDPVKDSLTLLILHYLAIKVKGLPEVSNEWFSISELSSAVNFTSVFKKRATDLIVKKYADRHGDFFHILKKVPGKMISKADAAIVIEAFEGVPVLIELWQADEDFEAAANILFDRSITQIFCTEDIVVLAEVIADAI